jgi:hypothetical protein
VALVACHQTSPPSAGNQCRMNGQDHKEAMRPGGQKMNNHLNRLDFLRLFRLFVAKRSNVNGRKRRILVQPCLLGEHLAHTGSSAYLLLSHRPARDSPGTKIAELNNFEIFLCHPL